MALRAARPHYVFFLEKSCRKMYIIFSAVQRQQRKSDVMTSFGLTTCSAVYYHAGSSFDFFQLNVEAYYSAYPKITEQSMVTITVDRNVLGPGLAQLNYTKIIWDTDPILTKIADLNAAITDGVSKWPAGFL
jgi:hypothetical protein